MPPGSSLIVSAPFSRTALRSTRFETRSSTMDMGAPWLVRQRIQVRQFEQGLVEEERSQDVVAALLRSVNRGLQQTADGRTRHLELLLVDHKNNASLEQRQQFVPDLIEVELVSRCHGFSRFPHGRDTSTHFDRQDFYAGVANRLGLPLVVRRFHGTGAGRNRPPGHWSNGVVAAIDR